ncbi:hypothetical protein CS8_002260 [Cupriavidus sp. 8B]
MAARQPAGQAVAEDAARQAAKRAEQQLQRGDPGGDAGAVHAALVDHPELGERERGKHGMHQHEADDGEAQRRVAANWLTLSKETIRRLMVSAGLWVPRKQRPPKVYQPRNRRACLGELIQIDGCDHRWFEERAPACTLLVYVDNATSRIMDA